MTPTNHEELRRLATEATPGPWTIHTEEVCSPIVAAMELSKLVHGSVFVPVLPMVVGSNGLATAVTGCGPTSVANAAYIAAVSPDAILALLADLDALRTRLAEVEKDGRAIRRMLCLSVAHMPYMDDGEASDQEIDFMRDSSADIEKKLMERNLKKYAAMGAQA